MATRLYFHTASFNQTIFPGTYPDSNGDTNIVIGAPTPSFDQSGADAMNFHRSMNTTKGTSQASLAITRAATNGVTQSSYMAKFISNPLIGVSSITAQTWVTHSAHAEGSTSSNFAGILLCIYVWRPSTDAKVGGQNIYDGSGGGGFTEPASINTERLAKGNMSSGAGRSISGVQDGDVIICELFLRKTTSSSTTFTDTWYYNGATEYPSGSNGDIVSDIASYIETPQDLTFQPEAIVVSIVGEKEVKNKFITKNS